MPPPPFRFFPGVSSSIKARTGLRARDPLDIAGHGALRPGRKAAEVLSGEAAVALDLSAPPTKVRRVRKTASDAGAAPVEPAAMELLAALKALRLEIAREIDKPAYIVFSDATLVDMAQKRPTSLDAFLAVDGVGQKKCELYGPRFIEAIEAEPVKTPAP